VLAAAGVSLLAHVLLPLLLDHVPLIAASGAWGHNTAIAVIVAVAVGLLVIPFGFVLDRSLRRLLQHIQVAGEPGAAKSFGGPNWLMPVSRALTSAVDQFHQREQGLRNQLREIEIRHRVSEAERRQFKAVLHALRDAVLVTDAFNEVVMANDAAAGILGFALDGATHKPVDQLITDEHLVQLIADMRENGNPNERRRVELELTGGEGEDGKPRVFEITLACVSNHKQEVAGVVTILHDLTRERELSQMKTDFVYKASQSRCSSTAMPRTTSCVTSSTG
jgi:PAS domain S-box-containing protein